jgi:hypothetical protein
LLPFSPKSSLLLPKNVNTGIYKIIVLLVILHGCETWSLTARERYRLEVFENRVLRRIFGRGDRRMEKTA